MTELNKTSLLQFPCEYPLKVFGRPESDFDRVVLGIVRRHGAVLPEGAVRSRSSSSGKYTALTITFLAASQQQLDAIYQDLSRAPEVLMSL